MNGQLIGDYWILERLIERGMGKVCWARDICLVRDVAVDELDPADRLSSAEPVS